MNPKYLSVLLLILFMLFAINIKYNQVPCMNLIELFQF